MAKKYFKNIKTRENNLGINKVSKKKKGTFVSKYKYIKMEDWEQSN